MNKKSRYYQRISCYLRHGYPSLRMSAPFSES